MSTASNNLLKHFESFLPDVDPGEMDAMWRAVEPHLPPKKRRRFFWLPLGAGMIATFGVLWMTTAGDQAEKPRTRPGEKSPAIHPTIAAGPTVQSPVTNIAVSDAQPKPASSADKKTFASNNPGQKNNRPGSTEPSVVVTEKIAPAQQMNTVIGPEQEGTVQPEEVQRGSAGVFAPLPGSDSVVQPEVLRRIGFMIGTNERPVSSGIVGIPRPQLWRSRTTLMVFAGPHNRKTMFYTGGSTAGYGWNAGVTLSIDLGKRWLLHGTGMVTGQRDRYVERADYYDAFTVFGITSSPYSGQATRYRLVTEEYEVALKSGYVLAAGIGQKVWRGKKAGVNLLLSIGTQQIRFSSETRRFYGTDTLNQQPISLSPLPATRLSSTSGKPRDSYHNFFVAPQANIYYNINPRAAVISRVFFTTPLTFSRKKKASVSDVPALGGRLTPERSSAIFVNLGIVFRL